MPSYLASAKNDDSPPAPVSCMQQKSMIWSQPKVGIDSSEAIMPVGAARHSSVGILAPASSDDVEEAKHGRAAVLDLHDLVAGHVAGLDEAERVVHAERRQDANVALREHL